MRRSKFIPAALILSVLVLGGIIAASNLRRPGQNGINQQGRNLVGQNMQSTLPYAGTPATLPGMDNTGPNRGIGMTGPTDNRDLTNATGTRLKDGTGTGLTGAGNNGTVINGTGLNGTANNRIGQNGTVNNGTGLNGLINNMAGMNGTVNNGTGLNGTTRQLQQQSGFNSQKAENIRRQLANITGIKNVNALVNGNTALVGYSPAGRTVDANATRKMITDRIKNADKTITNVVVSDSADFTSRLAKLAENIKNNRPVSDLNNEFNKLMQSVRNITR